MANDDFSKTTVVVLLVLAILVSILSSWTLYDQIKKASTPSQVESSQNAGTGQIKLRILSNRVIDSAAGSPTGAASTGQGEIKLKIIPQEG
ncbi:hypothetical protein D6764_02120 [Candidatus Woesearchaeota archaeon]|nr:MAG: hypothetical protein D6764_02120 [Candidatus Woesearchaeota archaeon]